MMDIAGENTGKKRFMDLQILGKKKNSSKVQSFQLCCVFCAFAKVRLCFCYYYRGYFRCTNRFTQKCLAVKQVQRSDKDPSIFEVKYVGNHTCNNNSTSPKTTAASFSVSMFGEGSRVGLREQREDTKKPKKTEQVMMISLEDVEYKDIFRTYSISNHEIEDGGGWKSNIFQENLSPATTTTSGSGMTSEIVTAPAAVEDWGDVDSYFSSLDNIIDLGQDLWS